MTLLTEPAFLFGFMLGVCPVGAVLFFAGMIIGRREAQREASAYGPYGNSCGNDPVIDSSWGDR